MTDLYPPIEAYETGVLAVGDGHQLYWETCGNPNGTPAVVLHGGPGSGCRPGHRQLFDPDRYRIVLFDQRNCGRSAPHASLPSTDLSTNTTGHLINDIEALRHHLGIEQWLVYGNSWGSTLALAYAEHHPRAVSAVVLCAVTMSRPEEIEWLYRGVGRFFPEAFARFRTAVAPKDRDGDLVEAYSRLLKEPNPEVRDRAARDWCAWEDAIVMTAPDAQPNPRYLDAELRMAFARIVTHYFRNRAWLEESELLRNIGHLRGIPGVLIHGQFDLSCPLGTAWELFRAWPEADLRTVRAGHNSTEVAMSAAVVAATDRFAVGS
jgi:proline iminopeptidase